MNVKHEIRQCDEVYKSSYEKCAKTIKYTETNVARSVKSVFLLSEWRVEREMMEKDDEYVKNLQ